MERDALELLQNTAIEAAGANKLDTHTPAIIFRRDGGGQEVRSIEQFSENRARYRGQFSTATIDDFAAYVRANPGGQGYIDAASMRADVFLNLGTVDKPGHGDWKASLSLPRTALWQNLLAVNGKRMGQKQLAEFLEDWSPFWSAYTGGSDALTGTYQQQDKALAAVRSIAIEKQTKGTSTVTNVSSNQTAMEAIEAKAAATDLQLPSFFMFDVETHKGLEKRRITLQVSAVLVEGQAPQLITRIVRLENIVEELADDFRKLLLYRVGDAATMLVGSFAP